MSVQLENNNYMFRSMIWTYQFLHTFQITDLKVSNFVQDCQIADPNVSCVACMCKQICERSLVLLLHEMK